MITLNTNTETNTICDIPVNISVEVGNKIITFKELSELNINSIISLDKIAGENYSIYANGKKIGTGTIVVVNECLGVKIVDLNFDDNKQL